MNNIFINFIYNKEYYFIRRENINYYTSIYHDISITDLYNQDYDKIINTATKCDGIQFSLHGIIDEAIRGLKLRIAKNII